ncbi:hypothetical protein [Chryseosolibacter indicus]|uniref:DUF4174 domain-containing protein n=1 Tax=Chryseosolibacter indicus TaxID=2782351 RepID=A0ABS5VUZ0_9BACT|nr:hypothetical protein [Chryseosolibacter indicus]MBT1705243.1 hypothetical protein [Chryseosolibacter indicus]
MRSKKLIFLFVALLLPVLIFVFLRIFGKNQFEVPLIFEEGVTDVPSECNFEYTSPYVLPDSLVNKLSIAENKLTILTFARETQALRRVVEGLNDDGRITMLNGNALGFKNENLVKNCVLLLKSPNDVVLFDGQKQIRGYYDSRDRDELDRLEAELKILLEKY